MKRIMKYLWIVAIILLLPLVVNFILLIPSFTPIVGDNISWLGFWGSYLGAIISASVAFIILAIQYKQNSEENERNRKLQINVIVHQQEQTRLNHIIDMSVKLLADADVSKYYTLCKHLGEESQYSTNMLIDGFSSKLINRYDELNLYVGLDRTCFMIRLNLLVSSYDNISIDIRSIIRLFCRSNWMVNIPTLEEFSEEVSEEMKFIITKRINSKDYFLHAKDCREIIGDGILLMDKKRLDMNHHISKYISSERERIDNILIEHA